MIQRTPTTLKLVPHKDYRMTESFQLFTSLRYDAMLPQVSGSLSSSLRCWNSNNASPFYMLDHHRDRMLKAAEHWGWTKAVAAIKGIEGLAKLELFLTAQLQAPTSTPRRVKVTLSKEGELGLESSPVPATSLANLFPETLVRSDSAMIESPFGTLRKQPRYDVYLDFVPTHRSEFTHYKTTKRELYDSARLRAHLNPTDTKEVLLINESDGTIMEGTLTTPYFFRGNRWVTPPVSKQFSSENGSGGQDGTTRRYALEHFVAVEEEVKAASVVDGEEVWLSNGVRGFVFGQIRLEN